MSREPNLKTVAYAIPTANITKLGKDLKAAGYEVIRDNSAGTFVAKADGEVVVRALQMGSGRPWMLRADPRVITATN